MREAENMAPDVATFTDPATGQLVRKIGPGEYCIADDGLITTVLGSCVAVCAYDADQRVGGMNHFMLPGAAPSSSTDGRPAERYGEAAMVALISALVCQGACKDKLIFKVFGGARVLEFIQSRDIGSENGQFALAFLEQSGFSADASDLGGECARRIMFEPSTGAVWVRKLAVDDLREVVDSETQLLEAG